MKRTRPGLKQVNFWLSVDLLAELKTYQHAHQLDSLTEAVDQLLRQALEAGKGPG